VASPLLSVVTGTYNRLPHLENLVESVRASLLRGIDHEIVVVDGGSTDGTLDWCSAQPDIVLIEQGELRGAIDAFNAGAFAAQGKYVLLANDDVVFLDPGSILRAVVHLEDHRDCGAVAFADDRPAEGKSGYRVEGMPGQRGTHSVWVNYAQVGLFRKWLGDACNWWRGTRGMTARTYGGDNALSCEIWERGYTVDAVDGVTVHDDIVRDALRQTNTTAEETHPDSAAFYTVYPYGAKVADAPTLPNPDERLVRVLYLPVFEPGYERQKESKRGLREALARRFITGEWDYLDVPQTELRARFQRLLGVLRPDVLLMQAHGGDRLNATMLEAGRLLLPNLTVINWVGDVWERSLLSEEMLELLKYVDLQLVVNASVLPKYAAKGVAAAYWQVAPEPVDEPLPDAPAYDVLWLANGYSNERQALGETLRALSETLGFSLGIYGNGWPEGWSEGDCTYDFAFGRALYQSAKLAISDNQFTAEGFVSNRLFEVLAAGGAVLLQQIVPELEKWTGLLNGRHYVGWLDADDLAIVIKTMLTKTLKTAKATLPAEALAFIQQRHTFDHRVKELFGAGGLLATQGRRTPYAPKKLKYLGTLATPFGVMGAQTQRQYVYTGGVMAVMPEDAPAIMQQGVWVEVD
jgi:glycosyltransferase involved in cell wall biosynthesis